MQLSTIQSNNGCDDYASSWGSVFGCPLEDRNQEIESISVENIKIMKDTVEFKHIPTNNFFLKKIEKEINIILGARKALHMYFTFIKLQTTRISYPGGIMKNTMFQFHIQHTR